MTKLSGITASIALFAVVASDVAPGLTTLNHDISPYLHVPRDLLTGPEGAGDLSTGATNPPPAIPNPATVYGRAWCKGSRLMLSMTLPAVTAQNHISPIYSPWTGALYNEMAAWGYNDETVYPGGDNSCDLEHLGLKRVCEHLRISTKTRANGGPNKCYKIVHKDGPAVIRLPPNNRLPEPQSQYYKNGARLYRVSSSRLLHPFLKISDNYTKVTNARYEIAVNAQDGLITFVDVHSPKTQATRLWGGVPNSGDLPALRALSDIAWGLWYRDCSDQQRPLAGISKIISVNIANDDTDTIIDEALSKWTPPPGYQRPSSIPPWPGITFDTSTEAGLALLGKSEKLDSSEILIVYRLETDWYGLTRRCMYQDLQMVPR